MFKVLLILMIFISCKNSREYREIPELTNSIDSIFENKKDTISIVGRKMSHFKKWVQYKKIPVDNKFDTIPYRDCYITIDGNVFSYFREGDLIEKRILIRDGNFEYEVYTFKEKPDDFLQYLDIEGKRLVLKRDNYDGVQEYFVLTE